MPVTFSVLQGCVMSQRLFSKVLGFIGYTVQYGCIAHCTFEYIGEFVMCSGPSMEPTITDHDVVFSERLSRHLYRIEKGDIVIAKSPFDPNMNICKRVIGLEGDKVCTSGPSDTFKTHTFNQSQHGSSHQRRYQEVMCGWKVIICRTLQTHDVTALFPMDSYKDECV
ncbi:mitochondrial inner membrane protease subunit 1 isoform X3 [Pangasianodon hypophthalmus]|uniref:mitochondrial inner membrane protease subunit 1 isoform X3 n=1 Tax=Pangasianodon hypophthalmus TaxID=310915 RepID=UPI00147E3ABB|nr:mitochondrial inner membrane protease subunit 1 isoform X3 [Pangasianodon hypophthalmus]